MKASGNTTSCASCFAAECVRAESLSMVRSRSKTTGEACTTATFEVIESVTPSVLAMGMLPELAKVATENVRSSYHGRLAWNCAGGGLVFGTLRAFAKSDGVICRSVQIKAVTRQANSKQKAVSLSSIHHPVNLPASRR